MVSFVKSGQKKEGVVFLPKGSAPFCIQTRCFLRVGSAHVGSPWHILKRHGPGRLSPRCGVNVSIVAFPKPNKTITNEPVNHLIVILSHSQTTIFVFQKAAPSKIKAFSFWVWETLLGTSRQANDNGEWQLLSHQNAYNSILKQTRYFWKFT